jgi:1,4-dihydroxy-6-naphthoate synthase
VGDPPLIEVAFDKIPQAVLDGQADLGLLIHEGQITHQQMGLTKVLDLGESCSATRACRCPWAST